MSSSGPSQACKHAISVFCTKHHAQFRMPSLILNLLGKETCKGCSDMFCVYIWHCLGSPYSIGTRSVAMHCVPLSDACLNASQICKSALLDLGTPDNTGAQFKLCQPQNAIHFPPYRLFLLFKWRKLGQYGAPQHKYAHRRWLDQEGKWLRELPHYTQILEA
jgi:hypothetical protein